MLAAHRSVNTDRRNESWGVNLPEPFKLFESSNSSVLEKTGKRRLTKESDLASRTSQKAGTSGPHL